MIYFFNVNEEFVKLVPKTVVKSALQKLSLTDERYVSDKLTIEVKGLDNDEFESFEYMAIQSIEDSHKFHYYWIAQKSSENDISSFVGVQAGIEELRKSPVIDKRPENTEAKSVVSTLLQGTNWSARYVADSGLYSTRFYYTSVFEALIKVCEVWNLEMQFFVEMNGNKIGARFIDFKKKIGEAVGKRVVYGHNALQILQEVEKTNIFTALIGRGKGVQVSSAGDEKTGENGETTTQEADGYGRKITFEDIDWKISNGNPVDKPKGQLYVEIPSMTLKYGIKEPSGKIRPKVGFVEFSEVEDPNELLQRTYETLVNSSRPQLTLKTSTVYLKNTNIGDTIRVVRHDKHLDYNTRIFEITFNRLNDQSSDIKLGDRIGGKDTVKAQVQDSVSKAVDEFVTGQFTDIIKSLPDNVDTADGRNHNWGGSEDPVIKNKGRVFVDDIWWKPDSEHEGETIMLRWTGEVWEEIARTYNADRIKEQIEAEVDQVKEQVASLEAEQESKIQSILDKSTAGLSDTLKEDARKLIEQAKLETDGKLNQAKLDITDQIKSEVTKVEGKIPAQISTRNLIIGTNDMSKFTRHVGSNSEVFYEQETDSINIKTSGYTSNKWSGFGFDLALDKTVVGEKFSVRVPVYVDPSIQMNRNLVINLKIHESNNNDYIKVIKPSEIKTGEWQTLEFTATSSVSRDTSAGKLTFYVFLDQNGWVKVKKPIMVRGDVIPTDWTPAPEDFDNDLTVLKSSVTQNSDQISQLLTKTTQNGDAITSAQNLIKSTADSFNRTLSQTQSDLDKKISQVAQTADGIVSRVTNLLDSQNLVYDPTNYSKYRERKPNSNLSLVSADSYKLLRITQSGLNSPAYKGFNMPLHSKKFIQGEKLSYRVNLWVDVLPDDFIGFEIKNGEPIAAFNIQPTKTGPSQIFTGTFTVSKTVTTTDEFSFHVWLKKNGTVAIGQLSIVRGDVPPSSFVDSTSSMQIAAETQMSQLAGSWAVRNLTNSGDILGQINLNKDGSVKINDSLISVGKNTYIENGVIKSAHIASIDAGKITAGTLDASKARIINLDANSISGLDANFLKAKIGTAVVDWLRGKTISAQNGAMSINLNQADISFNQNATINFNSANNALVRRKGTHTAFVHFNDVSSSSDKGVGSLYASIGVTSSGDGINSASSGRFSGLRVFRAARGTAHEAILDKSELYGDTIVLKDDFYIDRGFKFNPETIGGMIDMNYLVNAVRSLARCWLHLNNVGWDPQNGNLSQAIIGEFNKYMKDL